MSKVYVLGAGAAASYKGSYLKETSPVAKNFFQKAMRLLDIHQIRDRHFADEQLQYEEIFCFIEKLWGIPREDIGQSDLDMEEVLTLLNIEIEEDVDGRDRLLRAYEEYLLLMALTFDKILYGPPCPHHRAIARSLKPGDAIISFNYELLMDYALRDLKGATANWSIRDGYGIPCQDITHHKHHKNDNGQPSNVHLYKLHGSLNWLFCPQCGQLYSYDHSDEKGHSRIISGMANLIKCSTEHCCKHLSRVIIPPTLMKNYQSIPFIPDLWRQARGKLAQATEIIVIGYSFPPTDFRSNWMFRKAITQNKVLKRVVVVDSAEGYQLERLLAKHKSIFRVQEVDYYPDIDKFTEMLPLETNIG
ncbi:SIR2 family protein [Desulforamulus ferrireducens]|uniref:Uncharacterized protein n=1 Tax=Desulforamulus ferrireducens TaxID=1833852 RepID=A0A1S6IXL7_9FIRM|nr:SIR2 family protein [Desulforamulus ferrireducens]AQS59502.1 hypothetical protein B0537_10665 [Desulforamulus ferrireducens]